MSNRLPRALLADIAAVIGSGDHASALMMLGDESGPEASAAVSSYRAQCAAALGDFDAAERHLRVALDLVERRMAALPADEAARERLAAARRCACDADPRGHLARAYRRAPSPHARSSLHEGGTRT